MSKKKTALWIALLAGSLLLPRQLLADKLEGIILQNEGSVLQVLDVVSYEKYRIPVTESTQAVRKNHEDITAGDLKAGWFVEVEGNTVTVKTGRFEEVQFEGYQEQADTPDALIVDGQRVSLKDGRVIRKKNFPGDVKAGMKTSVLGIRQEDGTVKAKEVFVEPNDIGLVEKDMLRQSAKFVSQLDRKPNVIKNSAVQQYVESVGEKLIPGSAKGVVDFRFHVLDNASINAFAARSSGSSRIRGSVYVTTGLLEVLENEAQLASVLGHEIAHITHEHMRRQAARGMWTEIALSAAGAVIDEALDNTVAEIFAGVGLGLAGSAIINGFSRDLEDQADRVGLRYLYEAGYDPLQAPRVWHIFTQHTRDMNKVANFFYGSHSTHIARKRNLFREISQSYFAQVNQGLPVKEDAYRENALRHATNQDRAALYGFAPTAPAPAALPKYSGVLFVPWRAKSHKKLSSEDKFVRASDSALMHLQTKGVDLVDDDFYQRPFHQDPRIRRLAHVTEDTKELPLSSVISTARSLGADSVLLLEVSRPTTRWIKLEAQCYDLTGKQLWRAEGTAGNAFSISTKGHVQKSVNQLTAALDKKLGGSCLPLQDEKP